MQEDNDEEDGVEIGNDGRGADDSAPSETHNPVGDIVGFARVGPESACQETIPATGHQKTNTKVKSDHRRTHEQFGCMLGF